MVDPRFAVRDLGLDVFAWDNLKFPFAGPQQVIEAKIGYPRPAPGGR